MNHSQTWKEDLVSSKDSERLDDLLGRVAVRVLTSHEVEERVKGHVAETIRIDCSENALKVSLAL